MTPPDGAGSTATNRLDTVFEVGIVLKGLDGLLGTSGGALLLPQSWRSQDQAGEQNLASQPR